MGAHQTTPPPSRPDDRDGDQGNLLSVLSLCAGIGGLVVSLGPVLFAVFGFALGATAVLCGILALRARQQRGLAIAGFVLGALTLLFATVGLLMFDGIIDPSPRGGMQIGTTTPPLDL